MADISHPVRRLRALLTDSTLFLNRFGRRAKPLPPFVPAGNPLLARIGRMRIAPMERYVSERDFDQLVGYLAEMEEHVRAIEAASLDSEDNEGDSDDSQPDLEEDDEG